MAKHILEEISENIQQSTFYSLMADETMDVANQWQLTFYCLPLDTVWCKFLTGENIYKFDEFLSICQHFPYQNFPQTFCLLPARPLFHTGRYC